MPLDAPCFTSEFESFGYFTVAKLLWGELRVLVVVVGLVRAWKWSLFAGGCCHQGWGIGFDHGAMGSGASGNGMIVKAMGRGARGERRKGDGRDWSCEERGNGSGCLREGSRSVRA
jgi:hypothetical protein